MNVTRVFNALRKGIIPPPHEMPEPLMRLAVSAINARGKISTLTSVERLFCSIFHKEPDRVPVTPILGASARQINGISFPELSLNGEKAAEVFYSGFDFVGGDFIQLLLDLSVEAADFGQPMIYPENSTPRPDYRSPLIKEVGDYKKVKPIRLSEAPRMQAFLKFCEIMVRKVGFKGIGGGFVFGPAGVLSMMRGAENFFKDCLLHPKEVIAAAETVTGVLIEYVEAQCDNGIPAVVIDTLYASASALPKKVWEEIEGPFVKQLSRAIKKRGCFVGIHNCGHKPYVDVQLKWIEPEVISIACIPDDCGSLRELKEKYGDRITIVGCIPTQLLITGTPMEVMDECRRQIDVLAKGGGFVLAPGCEYPPNIPLTNAFAIVEAAKRYG